MLLVDISKNIFFKKINFFHIKINEDHHTNGIQVKNHM